MRINNLKNPIMDKLVKTCGSVSIVFLKVEAFTLDHNHLRTNLSNISNFALCDMFWMTSPST